MTGAKVVGREGYRFREDDKLTEPDGWQASSHRPLRAAPKMPAAITLEPNATVGVVTEHEKRLVHEVELYDRITDRQRLRVELLGLDDREVG